MQNNTKSTRAAYSFAEFADIFGRERTWAYRLAEKGKPQVIEGFGKKMIPATEIERITGAAKARA